MSISLNKFAAYIFASDTNRITKKMKHLLVSFRSGSCNSQNSLKGKIGSSNFTTLSL